MLAKRFQVIIPHVSSDSLYTDFYTIAMKTHVPNEQHKCSFVQC